MIRIILSCLLPIMKIRCPERPRNSQIGIICGYVFHGTSPDSEVNMCLLGHHSAATAAK